MKYSRDHLYLFLVLIFSSMLLTIRLGNTHLWDQDEGFYATAAKEMVLREDWIVPTFNDRLFGHKPPIMYWGMMIGYRLFGINEVGARMASSLLGVCTAILTYVIGKRLFNMRAAFAAAIALSSSILFVIISRSATADVHLTFFVLLSLTVWVHFYFGAFGSTRNEKLCWMGWKPWALVYAIMGVSLLTKGPIGFLFPTSVIGLFLLSESQVHRSENITNWQVRYWQIVRPYFPISFLETVWRMRPFTAVIMLSLVAGPWYALVQWKTDGEFLKEFIGVHHLGRFSHAMDNHSGPIYYYVIACLVGLFPWSSFAIPALLCWITPTQIQSERRSIRFVSCWIAIYLVIFSLASTKLPNYVLPAYPAFAIVIGRYFAAWTNDIRTVHRGWLLAGWCVFISVGLVMIAGIPIASFVRIDGRTVFDRIQVDPEIQKGLIGVSMVGLPLVLLGGIGLRFLNLGKYRIAAGVFAGASAVMIATLSQVVAPQIDRMQATTQLTESWHRIGQSEKKSIHVLSYFRPSMVFYLGGIIDFTDELPKEQFAAKRDAGVIITTSKQLIHIQEQLPSHMQVLQRFAQFPSGEGLVVLGDDTLLR